jgi:hypothetical protein
MRTDMGFFSSMSEELLDLKKGDGLGDPPRIPGSAFA